MMNLPNRIKLTAVAYVFLTFMPALSNAQDREAVDVHALGPQVGERVPDFRLPDQYGRFQTLDSIMGPNGAMLLFHRSADW